MPKDQEGIGSEPRRESESPLTRRMDRGRFVRLVGAAGVAAGLGPVLAACGGDEEEAAPTPPAATGETGATPPAAGGATGRAIRIGLVSPQTGPLALFGETDTYVVDQMTSIFADGIDVGGTMHPVEIEIKDTQSDPNRAATVTQELIDGGVDLILPGATPETTNPVGDTAEANGVPCLSCVAPWQPWFFRNPDVTPATVYQWQYHFFWGLEDVIAVFLDMWSQVETNKVAGGLFPNDGDGNAWGDPNVGFPPPLKEAGYTLVDPGRYQNLQDDFSAQISAYKKAKAEVVTGVPLPPDFTTFRTQSVQQDFLPKIISVGKALLFPAAVDALKKLGDGMSSEVWWAPSYPFKSSLSGQTSQELGDAWIGSTSKQWTQPLGYTHAVFEVAADALSRTADIDDPAALVEAIRTTDLDTVAGHVSWADEQLARVPGVDEPIQNVAKMKLAGGQWNPATDFPFELVVVSNAIFPEVETAAKLRPIPGSA
jgi:branched-chain amino acid transport system substrate-binding protein